ncbi:hypothetical protein [Nostoc sp.]
MAIAYFYFHAELNHFLPRHHKQVIPILYEVALNKAEMM